MYIPYIALYGIQFILYIPLHGILFMPYTLLHGILFIPYYCYLVYNLYHTYHYTVYNLYTIYQFGYIILLGSTVVQILPGGEKMEILHFTSPIPSVILIYVQMQIRFKPLSPKCPQNR